MTEAVTGPSAMMREEKSRPAAAVDEPAKAAPAPEPAVVESAA
jgi:hypothetical protein